MSLWRKLLGMTQRLDFLLVVLSIATSIALVRVYGPVDLGITCVEPCDIPAPVEQNRADVGPIDPAVAKAKRPVRFLMYNVKDYFVDKDPPRSPHKRKIKPIQLREAVADNIAEARPEVIGLIEIGGPAALDDLAERLAARGLHYAYRKVLTRWGEDRALAVLSMHPIVHDNSVADCKLRGTTRRLMLRGILDITVQPKGDPRTFRIIGAHLKSQVGDDPESATSLRMRECLALREHVHDAMQASPQTPLLVYGDWNDNPQSVALGPLTMPHTSTGDTLRLLKPRDKNEESWTIYYKEGFVYNTFDQIYVNRELARRMGRKSKNGIVADPIGRPKPSDHRALWCDMY